MKCKCEACDLAFGDLDPRSPDGYCSLCSEQCFPMTRVAGRDVRSAKSLTARENLHALARVTKSAAENLPKDPDAVAAAARQEAANAVVRIAAPLVEKAGKAAVDFGKSMLDSIRDRIGGTNAKK